MRGAISLSETPRGDGSALQSCHIKAGHLSGSSREQAGESESLKMLLPRSLASALRWGFLADVRKDLHKKKRLDELCWSIFSLLLYKWMLKPACY